jgi:hypothetical protein
MVAPVVRVVLHDVGFIFCAHRAFEPLFVPSNVTWIAKARVTRGWPGRKREQRIERFIHRVAGFSLLQPSQEPDSDLQTGYPRASAIRTIAEAIFFLVRGIGRA